MFGYVKPDLPYLYMKDDTLYKALYCGLCKSIGSNYGQIARFGLSYEIAFTSAIVHNLRGTDVVIDKERCVAHPVVPRPMTKRDGITEACAAANVALVYYKIKDDIIDSGKGKARLAFFSRAQNKAKERHPDVTAAVAKYYAELRESEKAEESRIDVVCDHFGLMVRSVVNCLLQDERTEDTDRLFYYLGKWIYLIDALDDYDKDVKNKNYNPFYYAFGKKPEAVDLIGESGKEIAFLFSDIFVNIENSVKNCKWKFNHDLIDNILLKGLPKTTLSVMEKVKGKKGKRT